MFYQSYILPCIDYGSITWGSASSSNIERLNKLQKRAAPIILRTDFNTPSQEMFQELGWSPVPNRIKYNKAVLTYRALNNLTPAYITNLLKPMSQVHSLNLRSSENGSLYVPNRVHLYIVVHSLAQLLGYGMLYLSVLERQGPWTVLRKTSRTTYRFYLL